MAVKPKATPEPSTAVSRAKVVLPAAVIAAMNTDVAAFQDRLGAPAGSRIAITQDRKFRDPLGTKHDTVSGIIVDFIAKKAWYVNEYDKDNIVPPNCFTLGFEPHDSMEPSPNSPERQNDGCKLCPKNQFKTARNGKGKACKDAYIVALLPPDFEADTPLMTLEISATGLRPFEKYVRDLARDYGRAPYCFSTEFSMDEAVDYSSVRTGNPQELNGAQVAMVLARREEAAKMLAVEPNVSEFDEKVRAPALAAPKRAAPRAAAARK